MKPQNVLYKKVNKQRVDGIYFYLEDDDYNPVDFNGETITFTIQLRKIQRDFVGIKRNKIQNFFIVNERIQ